MYEISLKSIGEMMGPSVYKSKEPSSPVRWPIFVKILFSPGGSAKHILAIGPGTLSAVSHDSYKV